MINIYGYDDAKPNGVGTLLASFEALELTNLNAFTPTDNLLAVGQSADFWVEVVMKKEAGNAYQESALGFDIVAIAIQSKNNS